MATYKEIEQERGETSAQREEREFEEWAPILRDHSDSDLIEMIGDRDEWIAQLLRKKERLSVPDEFTEELLEDYQRERRLMNRVLESRRKQPESENEK